MIQLKLEVKWSIKRDRFNFYDANCFQEKKIIVPNNYSFIKNIEKRIKHLERERVELARKALEYFCEDNSEKKLIFLFLYLYKTEHKILRNDSRVGSSSKNLDIKLSEVNIEDNKNIEHFLEGAEDGKKYLQLLKGLLEENKEMVNEIKKVSNIFFKQKDILTRSMDDTFRLFKDNSEKFKINLEKGYTFKNTLEHIIIKKERKKHENLLTVMRELGEEIIFSAFLFDEEELKNIPFIKKNYKIREFKNELKPYSDCMIEVILKIKKNLGAYYPIYRTKREFLKEKTENFSEYKRCINGMLEKDEGIYNLLIEIYFLFKESNTKIIRLPLPDFFEYDNLYDIDSAFKINDYSNLQGMLYLPIDRHRLNYSFNVLEQDSLDELLEQLKEYLKNNDSELEEVSIEDRFVLDTSDKYFYKKIMNYDNEVNCSMKENGLKIMKKKLNKILKNKKKTEILKKIMKIDVKLNKFDFEEVNFNNLESQKKQEIECIIKDFNTLEKNISEFENKVYFVKYYLNKKFKIQFNKFENYNYLMRGFYETDELLLQINYGEYFDKLSYEENSFNQWVLKKVLIKIGIDYNKIVKPLERTYKDEISYKKLEEAIWCVKYLDVLKSFESIHLKKEKLEKKQEGMPEENQNDSQSCPITQSDEKINQVSKIIKYDEKKDDKKKSEIMPEALLKQMPNSLYREKKPINIKDRANYLEKLKISIPNILSEKQKQIELLFLCYKNYIENISQAENYLSLLVGQEQRELSCYNAFLNLYLFGKNQNLEINGIIELFKDENEFKRKVINFLNHIGEKKINSDKKNTVKVTTEALKVSINLIKIAVDIIINILDLDLKRIREYDRIKIDSDKIIKKFPYLELDSSVEQQVLNVELGLKKIREGCFGFEKDKKWIKDKYFNIIDYYIAEGRKNIE